MTPITKTYSGSIDFYISEFENIDLLDELELRQLSKSEQEQLFMIADSYKPKELFLSNYIDFQSFVDDCITKKADGVVDKSCILALPITIIGDLKLRCLTNIVITNRNDKGFILDRGIHEFENFTIEQTNPLGEAFYTVPTPNIIWKNTFTNLKITGGKFGYNSSRGGTEAFWSVSSFKNTHIDVSDIAITVFSQDGPFKALHLEDVQLKTIVTHNIYVHPSVSLNYKNVTTLGAGKLMQHQYSGTGNGGYGTGVYSIFENVDTKDKAFEMTSLKDDAIQIINCKIAPYVTSGVPAAFVNAVDSEFMNNGNGALLNGTLTNCKGTIWSFDNKPLTLINCNVYELSMRAGGTIIADNTTVEYMSVADRGKNFDAIFRNSLIKTLQDDRNGDGVINLINTPKPGLYFGQQYRPEIIKTINKI